MLLVIGDKILCNLSCLYHPKPCTKILITLVKVIIACSIAVELYLVSTISYTRLLTFNANNKPLYIASFSAPPKLVQDEEELLASLQDSNLGASMSGSGKSLLLIFAMWYL